MTNDSQRDRATEGSVDSHGAAERAHLEDVADGCGCAEVWEHLSAQREAGAD